MRTATLIDPTRTERPYTDGAPGDGSYIGPAGRLRTDRTRTPALRTDGRRPADNRPVPRSALQAPRVGGTACSTPVGTRGRGPVIAERAVIRRRRRTAVAILAGVGLALAVWVIGVVGQNYAASMTPTAVSTEVVHVRSGESLSTIASRVAPDMPREVVVDDIVALNDLGSSALRVGQPLLTPLYR
ncbi:LysM peptidoglycan-binding domain-containing protein [Gordonia sp. zg691]|uniref:LysM peptidoglycan-binding domain-containing protein n=1 Tax=Gordonia jinghuaiqii TaxID=2758710 RepID=UPI001662626A|nr:LysM peptidoglycan-binding domain-containing protein [Gordonia jinghuaiqii]MBD0861373.1 LysM peptidoglycan-binding domain-containing protein [Gordonia jinghuaiqii]